MSKRQPLLAQRTGPLMGANPARVLLRRMYPSSHKKAENIVERINALSDAQVAAELSFIIDEWNHRHDNLRTSLRHRYREVCLNLRSSFQDWSEDRKCLVGAYFLQEYSVESAALFNPSIVPHPDQSNVVAGNMRVILSLRATGEGHISSVTFREGVLTTHNRMILEPSLLRLVEAKRQTSEIEVAAFTKELRESHMRTKAWKQEHTTFYEAFMKLIGNQESFSVDQARQACAALLNQFKSEAADTAANAILMLVEANYTVRFEKGSALSQRVLFPSAPSQSNGIEDARFVRFVHDDGSIMYYATFTAYNGRSTLSQIMETSDFNSFRFVSLSGEVREKGMALFPRKVGGSYVMLSRQDDESVMITFSQSLYKWEDPIPLLKPVEPWESFKMGNCGSPIETPQGWIVITHGVGPMRRYSIGAALLDLNDPTKVLARLKDPLLAPNEVEREGYVPNVVYSCGSMLRGDTLIIPFANSDSVSSFASVSVTSLMSAFQRSHTDAIAPALKAKASQKGPQAPVAPAAPTVPAVPAVPESAPLSGTGSALTTPAAAPTNSPARRVKHDFVRRIVFIGDYLPRKCGIATFTHDLRCALAAEFPNVDCVVVAVNDNDDGYMYSKEVVYEFKEQDPVTYLRVADYINGCGADVVCVQHEYGIYGGPCGVMLLQLLRALRVPIVTTLHTILQDPNPDQRQILASILSASSLVVTMAQKGMELLSQVYLADMSKVRIILHGIPEMEYPDTAVYKAKLGFDPKKKIILTFGLLSPNKGIEFAIDALGTTINRTSNFTYVVLGQTHPGIIKNHGEMYRHGLAHQAKERGLNDHIVFVDQFVDLPLLKEYIAACDIYLTPYLHEAQITSGTLSYAFGMGSAVVSTPYWHASELLADGRGCLVPFRDSEKLANILADLLLDDDRRIALKKQAFEHGRTMTWSNSAAHYMEAFEMAAATRKKIEVQPQPRSTLPAVKLDHLMRLTDDTGLIQHARFSVPDREHGYCVDDNARALLLYSRLKDAKFAFPPDTAHRIDTYFAFVAHAQDLQTRRFRNFMRFDRDWLEEVGSEDSHGRTIQALGACVRFDVHRDAATSLFLESFALVKDFSSPRSWAFSLLGFVDFLSAVPHHEVVELRDDLVERLVKTFDHHAKDDWQWFEATATYDNAVLPQSLVVAGAQMNNSRAVQVGLQSLAWLFNKQVTPDNIFVPIGNDGWAHSSGMMALFDQQPLEASSMCQACIAADRIATQDDTWGRRARIAFDWFMGRNVLGKPLYDPRSHGCCDGLHEFRINLNQGGESILAYLLALVELKRDELGRSQTPTPKLGFSMALPGVA